MINNTITEIKNTLERINSRITEAEEWISELEDRKMKITAEEESKEKKTEKNWGSSQSRWENIKCTNIWMSPPKKEEKKKRTEKTFEEIIVENFPNKGKDIVKAKKHRESQTG